MILNDDLEELIRIAFESNPKLAEYYLSRIIQSMPKEISEVFLDGTEFYPPEIITKANKDVRRLNWLLTMLRR